MAKKIEKQKFDWNAFTSRSGQKIVVHCQTKEEAKQFCKLMHEHGLRWCNGERYINNECYHSYRERTFYSGQGTYGDIDFANEYGYIVLKFSLLYFTEESKNSVKFTYNPYKCSFNYKIINDDWLV